MSNTKNYILGGGISGLIYAYYNPEYKIITPDIGGQLNTAALNVILLHDTNETRNLLTELKIAHVHRKSHIGYYYDGYVHSYVDEERQLQIIRKKMTDCMTGKMAIRLPKGTDLSTPTNYIKVLDADFSEIVRKLEDTVKDRIIESSVERINGGQLLLNPAKIVKYDNLVSTLPAPSFWKLYGRNIDFPMLPVTYVSTWNKPLVAHDRYTTLYIAEDYMFTRIGTYETGEYSYEFTGYIPEDKIKLYLPNVRINSIHTNHMGRILPAKNDPPQDNIKFLGRFAQWLYNSKIQDVIKIAKNGDE